MEKYRTPTPEGRKQIAMHYLDGEKAEDIRSHYLERGVNIGDIMQILKDTRVMNAVCLERHWTYDIYEDKLRSRLRKEATNSS